MDIKQVAPGTLVKTYDAGVPEPWLAVKVGSCSCFCICNPDDVAATVAQDDGNLSGTPFPKERYPEAHTTPDKHARFPEDFTDDCEVLDDCEQPKRAPSQARTDSKDKITDSKAKTRPDFSGKWTLTAIEGDWETFLKEQGYGWMKRKTIAGLGYGVNKLTDDIRCEGDILVQVSVSPMRTVQNRFRLNGQQQEGTDPEGDKMLVTPAWDGEDLIFEVFGTDGKKKATTIWHLDTSKKRRQTLESPGGCIVQRIWTRQPQ